MEFCFPQQLPHCLPLKAFTENLGMAIFQSYYILILTYCTWIELITGSDMQYLPELNTKSNRKTDAFSHLAIDLSTLNKDNTIRYVFDI